VACSDEEKEKIKEFLVTELIGPDVWYQPKTTGKGCFGSIRVMPFPFTVVFQPDGGGKELIVSDKLRALKKLLDFNHREEVKAARRVRQLLRALQGREVAL
jgi:hypothetical protein